VATATYYKHTLAWASKLRKSYKHCKAASAGALMQAFRNDLSEYFRLCALARSKRAPSDLSAAAHAQLFQCRTLLESSLHDTLRRTADSLDEANLNQLSDSFYGVSKKQGVSVRMPLTTCNPTRLCASACYAHDVLDATPQSVVRGAINGWLAQLWQDGNRARRNLILAALRKPSIRATRAAHKELTQLPEGFSRRPYIRFSHVGEIVAYSDFANTIAHLVKDVSDGSVDCVVYTRHRAASRLAADLWVINFTLDPSSESRQSWAPPHARLVYSAFSGKTSSNVAVNFLEHHRHTHLPVTSGSGPVCPATEPLAPVRTCDGCRCKTCFEPPSLAGEGRSGFRNAIENPLVKHI
jgi:hypothetical protein